MKLFENLSPREQDALLKFPAYISLLAANADGKTDAKEKQKAAELAHIKTFSCNPLLSGFYKEADRVFRKNLDDLDSSLPMEKEQRELSIRSEIKKLEPLLRKLGNEYAMVMKESMNSFTEHVSKAHENLLVHFINPFME